MASPIGTACTEYRKSEKFTKGAYMIVVNTIPEVCKKFPAGLASKLVATELVGLEDDVLFSEYLGGQFHLVETDADLSEIPTMSGRSIREYPSGFDIMEKVGGYWMICMMVSNSGGNTYFVPLEIADRYPTIGQSEVM